MSLFKGTVGKHWVLDYNYRRVPCYLVILLSIKCSLSEILHS